MQGLVVALQQGRSPEQETKCSNMDEGRWKAFHLGTSPKQPVFLFPDSLFSFCLSSLSHSDICNRSLRSTCICPKSETMRSQKPDRKIVSPALTADLRTAPASDICRQKPNWPEHVSEHRLSRPLRLPSGPGVTAASPTHSQAFNQTCSQAPAQALTSS